jgi:hypothetical protein
MLDYAPDGMTGLQDWAISYASGELPEEGVLLGFIAASRRAAVRGAAPVFEPERMAGFCAAG